MIKTLLIIISILLSSYLLFLVRKKMTSYTKGELVKKVLNGKLLGMIIHSQNTEVKYQMGNQMV